MKLSITREALLKPLQLVAGVVERRQTLPIMANVLLKLTPQELVLVGTDCEVELQGRVDVAAVVEAGTITVPGRKFLDICRTLPEQSELEIFVEGSKLIIRTERNRFSLATLPAADFPLTEESMGQLEFNISQTELRQLIDNTSFAMAQQDVRYYLNGMLLEVKDDQLCSVATDGHRMALSNLSTKGKGTTQVIVPRKAILELSRLLAEGTDEATVIIGTNQIRVKTADYIFTSKLIDGRFPQYEKIIPQGGDKCIVIDRDVLKQALSRVSTLANEKHRGVRVEAGAGLLRVVANNAEQEEAEEQLAIDYQKDNIQMGFNINYLLDAVAALPAGDIKITLSNPDSSARVESAGDSNSLYVVMPMRL